MKFLLILAASMLLASYVYRIATTPNPSVWLFIFAGINLATIVFVASTGGKK